MSFFLVLKAKFMYLLPFTKILSGKRLMFFSPRGIETVISEQNSISKF